MFNLTRGTGYRSEDQKRHVADVEEGSNKAVVVPLVSTLTGLEDDVQTPYALDSMEEASALASNVILAKRLLGEICFLFRVYQVV